MDISMRKPGLGPWSSKVASTECFRTLGKAGETVSPGERHQLTPNVLQ